MLGPVLLGLFSRHKCKSGGDEAGQVITKIPAANNRNT